MTTTSTRRPTALVLLAALALGAMACGGGGSDTADAEEISATLAIISTNIETDRDSRGFEPATEGETLTVGDRVKTDQTGFAELTYHDGSWQRIEASATLTIDELTNAGDTNTVRTTVDVGDTWNRVETLTEPDDAYELDTPVATAAVRGTAFATSCPTTTECTFSVIEGTVEITPRTGDPVTLTAGQQLTITTDTPPGEPTDPGVDTLQQDPFIAENLTLDQTKTTDTSDGEGAAGDLDPDTVEACALLTADDVRAIIEANPESMLIEPTNELVEVGSPTPELNSCTWPTTELFAASAQECQANAAATGSPGDDCITFNTTSGYGLSVYVLPAAWSATECAVTHRGVCLQISAIGTEVISLPPSVESALRQRLDA